MKTSAKKYSLLIFFLIIGVFTINQLGNNYFDYSIISGPSVIKANLLKYFLSSYYKVSEITDNKSELLYLKQNKILKAWEISKNDSIEIYYLLPEKELMVLDNYQYYIKQGDQISSIEIGMQVYPDSTSDIFITTYFNLEAIKSVGKIKVNPTESIVERGSNWSILLMNPNYLREIEHKKQNTEIFTSKSEFKNAILNTLKL